MNAAENLLQSLNRIKLSEMLIMGNPFKRCSTVDLTLCILGYFIINAQNLQRMLNNVFTFERISILFYTRNMWKKFLSYLGALLAFMNYCLIKMIAALESISLKNVHFLN